MANPVLSRLDPEGDRFYPWKGESFWSVTTLIGGGVPKFGIAPWSAKMVAELVTGDVLLHGQHARAHAAVRRWARAGRADVVERQAAGGLTSINLAKLTELDLAQRWLKGEPDRVRDAAGAIGSDVHSEAEQLVLKLARSTSDALVDEAVDAATSPWSASLAGQEASFRAWLADWSPLYDAAEATVFNRPQAYAGTLDAIVRIRVGLLIEALARAEAPIPLWIHCAARERGVDGLVTLVVDYKAGRSVYPEVGLQLSAYARAEFVGMPDGVTELAIPAIDGGAVLHITPKRYRLRLIDIDDPVWNAFLFAREIYRFRKQIAPGVLGVDLAPAPAKRGVA